MISVIVPVHNTFRYIEECLNSILNQTYKDLEVICIDSSTDNTPQVLKKIADGDPRVRIIEDVNSSYGYKVNCGIREAKGEYISIVDSDDYIELDMYQRLLDVIVKYNADFVKSDYSSFIVENGENVITEYNDVLSDYEIYGKCVDVQQDYSILNKSGISIWTGLYNRVFLCRNNIYLNESEGASFQDAGFSILTHAYGRKICYIHESYYRYRTDNVNSSVKSQKKYRTIADEWAYIDSQIEKSGLNDIQLILALRIRKIMNYDWNYDRLEAETARKFAESVNKELEIQYINSGIYTKLEERFQNMFDKIYMDGVNGMPDYTKKIVDILKNNKVAIIGSGDIWEKIVSFDMSHNLFAIQHYYDVESRIAHVGDFYVTVKEISNKMYQKDMVYLIADNNEEEIKTKLEESGVSSSDIVTCSYFSMPTTSEEGTSHVTNRTQMKEVRVSIIVPVYNVEKYLEQCLFSLMHQTLDDIEILCVNDGSTDGSLEILERISKQDSRIRVISQENQGLAGARNTGLNNARGKYILFCDSDDMFKANAAEKLYEQAENNEVEIMCCDAKCVYMTERLVKEDNKDFYYQRGASYGLDTGKEIFARMMENNNYCDSACLLLINRMWLQNSGLKFYTGILYEDCLFTVQCMMKAQRVYHTNEQFYIYRVREGSIMTSHMGANNLYGRLIDLHYFNKLLCNEELTARQEWALVEFKRIVEYHARQLVTQLDEKEVDKLLEKPLTQVMLLELEGLGICGSKIRKRGLATRLRDTLSRVDKVEIYGAGIRGQRLLVYLQLNGYSEKVGNFVVTTNKEHIDKICGVEVKAVDEGWKPNDNNLLIIAFAGSEAGALVEKYRNAGIPNVMHLDGEFYQMAVDDIRKKIMM